TLADVTGSALKTVHPPEPVVASSVPVGEVAGYETSALTPLTFPSGSWPLRTSTSRAEPMGGVMMPRSRTPGVLRAASAVGHVTNDSTATFEPDEDLPSVALHPVLKPLALSASTRCSIV